MNPPNGVRGELETDRVEFARKWSLNVRARVNVRSTKFRQGALD